MPERLRLYLDQMLNLLVAETLREEGYDVVRASEAGQSRSDDYEILQKAISENRILITLDDDFGDWAILPLIAHPGLDESKLRCPCAYAASSSGGHGERVCVFVYQSVQHGQ